jgi:Ca2+-binding RTX toxin-like protein
MPTAIYGTNGRDYLYDPYDVDNVIYGYDADDTIFAMGGNDWIVDGRGADYIDGGWGFDTVDYGFSTSGVEVRLPAFLGDVGYGGNSFVGRDSLVSIEQVIGTAASDNLTGNDDFNILWGQGNADKLYGLGGVDWLYGGDDNDILDGGAGGDYLDGGAGSSNWAVYFDAPARVVASLVTGGTVGDAAGDVFVSIQNLWGSNFDDELRGDGTANRVYGSGGNDIIDGLGAADQLDGGAGDDTLDGGSGNDEMWGGKDNDNYIIDSAGDLVFEQIGEGNDAAFTSATYTLRTGQEIEELHTTNQMGTVAIDLIGNEFGNMVVGNDGANTIAGSRAGDDADGDGLEDYDGLDLLIGGGGNDRFVWTGRNESGVAGDEADKVQNFTPGEDLLVVSPIDANEMIAGNQAFTFIGTGAFTAAGQVRYFTSGLDTYIQFNVDDVLVASSGDVDSEMTIHLLGTYTVEASWFDL